MRAFLSSVIVSLLLLQAASAAQPIPHAVIADPPADAKNPARMEVIHVPTGGVEINGVVYVASGAGPHPTFVFFHGLPGNEKNLDLMQAVRRAGWNAVAINYRGSWGSPGKFSFAQNLEDAKAVLAYVRTPINAAKLNIDRSRIAIGGHSMGGWVAALTAAQDPAVLGTVTISAGDMGRIGLAAHKQFAAVVASMNDNRETLAGVSGESMAEELRANADIWTFASAAPRLLHTPLYVLYSADFVEADSVQLIKAITDQGGDALRFRRVPTDHSWSDKRITLAGLIVDWLETLKAR
jgi:pimeloyl-ACP methyl ester carboxylesterase